MSDTAKTTHTTSTCIHPEPEVSRFAGMTLCHHCWTLLAEPIAPCASHETPQPHEEMVATIAP
jgi:hypothetical protein